jgi:predicted flap endonuclease-1-like 5' DNA nuclease
MHWFSFILGLLAGWIIEWVIDLGYWRRRYYDCEDSAASLRTELRNAQTDLGAVRARTDEIEGLKGELVAAQARARALETELAEVRDSIKVNEPRPPAAAAVEETDTVAPAAAPIEEGSTVASTATRGTVAVAATAAAAVAEPDNLEIVEGIGPGIARLLKDNGIRTFADLALSSPDELRAILASAGSRFRVANPGTWPEQARLAARGKWDALKELQGRLQAGRG